MSKPRSSPKKSTLITVTQILQPTPAPVVPMALSGLWASLFSRNCARLRNLGRLSPRIRLAVGEPIPAAAPTPQTYAAVRTLRGEWR
jgi:1-acyl-sn-glycerol-3-phosphate acyltransferase